MNPVLALIITNVIWGGASPIFKFALQNIPPFTLAFIRFFLAGLIFLIPAINHWQKVSLHQWWQIFLTGFFGIFINITFFFIGVMRTESINAPIIASTSPIFLYFFSIFFLKEKPKFKVLVGIFISFIGLLVIVLSPVFFEAQKLAFGEIKGNLFILIATLGMVGQTLVAKNLLKKVNYYIVSAFSFLSGAILFLLFVPNELKSWSFNQLNFNGWLGIIYGVFFSSAIAYFLYYYGVSKINVQEVGIFAYIDPVAALLIAGPLLGERPTVWYFLGSLLVFGGIYLAEKRIHWHPIHRLKKKKDLFL